MPSSLAPEVPHQIHYGPNGGSGAMGSQSGLPKARITLLANQFERSGYSFSGWNSEASGKGTPYADGATITMGQVDLTLFAQWTGNPHLVTFEANGGEGAMPPQTMGTGQTAPLPVHGFSRSGYRFGGWDTLASGGGTSYADGAPLTMGTEGVTLFAQWVGVDNTVHFYPNGGEGSIHVQVAATGTSVKLDPNTYTRAGYVFTGWNTNPQGGGSDWADGANLTMGPAGLFLYAQWAPRSNTVTFHPNGGTGTMAALTLMTDVRTPLPAAAFHREGYTFAGWNTQALGGGGAYADQALFSMGAESVTLFAQWTPRSNTLAFQANGGQGTMVALTLPTGGTQKLPRNAFFRDGYTFAGWNTLDGGSGVSYPDGAEFSMGTASTTLYAQWTANRYVVRFDPHGGSGTMASLSLVTGTTRTLPPVAFTRPGYSFITWTTQYSGSGVAYGDGAPLTMGVEDVWLYAQWRAEVQRVSFDPNGGSGSMAPMQVATGSFFQPPFNAFVRPGYDFAGWNTDPSGRGEVYSTGWTSVMGPSALVLYAQWSPRRHLVEFEPNGGTGSMSSISPYTDSTFTLPANTFSRQGFLFGGWSTQPSGGGTSYIDQSRFTMGIEDVRLYAQWVPIAWTSRSYDSTRSPTDCYEPTTSVAFDGQTLLIGTQTSRLFGNITSGGVGDDTGGGGLLSSTDGGQTWKQFSVSGGLADSQVWGVAVVGSAFYAATSRGLSVSRDSGATWSTWTTASGLADNRVSSVWVSGNTVAVGTLGGVSLSFDGGKSWSNTSTAQGLGHPFVQDVEVVGTKVYAATWGGVSISADGGASWVTATTAQGLPNNLVYGVAVCGGVIYAATLGGSSLSRDGGLTWSSDPFRAGVVGYSFGSLPSFGVASDGSTVCLATEGGLYISRDNGNTWSSYYQDHLEGGPDTLAARAVTVYGRTIAGAVSGGAVVSPDAGTSWTLHGVVRSLGANCVFKVVASEGRLYAATSGGLSISTDGGNSWRNETAADGLATNEVRDLAVLGTKIFAVTDAWLSVSSDGGITWSKVNPFNNRAVAYGIQSVSASGSTVCAGSTGGVFVSFDAGMTWSTFTTSSGLISNTVMDVAVEGSTIAVATNWGLSVSLDRGVTWRSTPLSRLISTVTVAGGRIYADKEVSSDGGATWSSFRLEDRSIDGTTSLFVTDLAVEGSTLYAGTSDGVFVSVDNGATWVKNSTDQGLPSDSVLGVTVSDSKIYAATCGGVAIGTIVR